MLKDIRDISIVKNKNYIGLFKSRKKSRVYKLTHTVNAQLNSSACKHHFEWESQKDNIYNDVAITIFCAVKMVKLI